MRVVLASSLFVLLACGGAQKPAEGSAADTTALEPSASSAEGTPPPSESKPESKPTSSHAATSPAPSADAPAAAAPAAFHPTPTTSGSIDGKPFAPKLARASGAIQKDGRILLTLTEHSDCSGPAASKPGEGSLSILVTWKDGYKTDVGSLKRSGKKGSGEIGFARVSAAGKSDGSTTFKPTGRVTVVSAPTDQTATGKMSIDLQSGDYVLMGDLDVCGLAK
jgi:hypothetical protein